MRPYSRLRMMRSIQYHRFTIQLFNTAQHHHPFKFEAIITPPKQMPRHLRGYPHPFKDPHSFLFPADAVKCAKRNINRIRKPWWNI